ncbi:MAG: sulfotransferase domain-containing protein [Hyphomonadaceae bacterium]
MAQRDAYAHIAACTRDPLLIGTLPRSGTWMLRYFLSLVDHFSRSPDLPPIEQLFRRASAAEFHLDYNDRASKSQRVAISHWMCPGSVEMCELSRPDLAALLHENGSLEYQRKMDADHAGFHPKNDARIVFVYRNPLDVYRSYADLFEQRNQMGDRKPYPFNPMVPWGTELMNASSDRPFEFFIDNLLESGFAEFFVTYFASFLLVRDAFPDRVLFLKYEDAMRDRRAYLRSIVEFGRLGTPSQSADAFDKAVAATEIDAMRRYEAELGHAISGRSTFYGERNQTHLSVKKRDWRKVFEDALIERFCARVAQLDPRVLSFLPELSA